MLDVQRVTSAQVRAKFGNISDMTLWRWINDPNMRFPQPLMLRHRRYWLSSEIDAWVEAQRHKADNIRPEQLTAARSESPDGTVPGLYLITQPSGARSWAFRYRRNDGRPAKYTIGAATRNGGRQGLSKPVVSAREARLIAAALRDLLRAMHNPAVGEP